MKNYQYCNNCGKQGHIFQNCKKPIISSGIVATIVPKFGLFINLTGAFACTALAFILPVSIND